MTQEYIIKGGEPVNGRITVHGTKNFATKAMVAAILSSEPTTLINVPSIGDIDITLDMLRSVGASVDHNKEEQTLTINPSTISDTAIRMPHSGSNRIPILLIAPLIHRFQKASVPMMKGCEIGARQVDFHVDALQRFGGIMSETEEGFSAYSRHRLKGTQINLPYPSVGATETSLFLSVLAEGTSIIRNAAIEPEIMELIAMLQSMGAIIFTKPEREIIIEGVKSLSGAYYCCPGDRIEAASWASLACATDGEITIEGCHPSTISSFLSHYSKVGGGFQYIDDKTIRFYRKDAVLKPTMIETDVYPGFSTDWQQPFAMILTQAEGVSIIHETVFEKRFGYLKQLKALGVKAQVTPYALGKLQRFANKNLEISAIITGPTKLEAIGKLSVPDLRAGLAYVIAAAMAQGTTTLTNIHNLERGYGDLTERCKDLTLDIRKE